jgi:carboxymethylenebutenolidase
MRLLAAILLLVTPVVLGQEVRAGSPEIVEFPSGKLHLKAFLWRPSGQGPFPAILFSHGSGGPDALHTSGMTLTEAAEKLGPVFVKHGYVFLFPCRRGQGLSVDQGKFMQDMLKQEETAKGPEARQRLQLALMTGPQQDDTLAALSFLKTLPRVDPRRIGLVGHSFGGQLTLLAAERDQNLRAAVTFGAAANSWAKSPELRNRLLTAVDSLTFPLMLIHAANDYDTTPGRELAAELQRRHKTHVLKIYPAVGKTSDDGHNLVYNAISQWEPDVFSFLDKNVRP